MRRAHTALLILAALLVGCPPPLDDGTSGDGTSGGETTLAMCRGDFGDSADGRKIGSFIRASGRFTAAAADLSRSMKDGCEAIGTALGLTAADFAPQGDELPVRASCRATAAKLSSEIRELQAQANLRVEVISTPPRCEIDIDAYAGCVAECDVDYTPAQVDLQCEGGYLYGRCEAECSGQCSVRVQGACNGQCEGTCQAGCTGTCQGYCEGNCSARGADGQCNGTCDGVCRGTCSGGCTGGCEGECWVDGHASCEGSCRGGCSVDYQEPRCTGTVRPARVEADCDASCDARVRADVQCQRGETHIVITGEVGPDHEARVARLRAALSATWPALQETARRLRTLGEAGADVVESGRGMRGRVRALGARAVACVGAAITALPIATAQISVSIEVSVEVSASVGAS